jgi:hypothetical protein
MFSPMKSIRLYITRLIGPAGPSCGCTQCDARPIYSVRRYEGSPFRGDLGRGLKLVANQART